MNGIFGVLDAMCAKQFIGLWLTDCNDVTWCDSGVEWRLKELNSYTCSMSSTWMISWSNERPFFARHIGVPWHWNIFLGTVCRSPLMCSFCGEMNYHLVELLSQLRLLQSEGRETLTSRRDSHTKICTLLWITWRVAIFVFFLVYCSWSNLYFPNMIRKGAISPREKNTYVYNFSELLFVSGVFTFYHKSPLGEYVSNHLAQI